jgi:hypothetical protein
MFDDECSAPRGDSRVRFDDAAAEPTPVGLTQPEGELGESKSKQMKAIFPMLKSAYTYPFLRYIYASA